jgi:putative oxidoreductase
MRTLAMTTSNFAVRRPKRPIVARIVERLNKLVAGVPYAVIAVGLRLLMARVFFLDGQSKIEGPVLPFNWLRLDFSMTLPLDITDAALQVMQAQYARVPMSATKAAYLFTYAEFVLPICLFLGFATRLAACGLLVMTLLLQLYVMPQLWWSTHVYWTAILLVLMTIGPGAASLDALIRHFYEK